MKLLKEGEELDEEKRREGNEIKRMEESNVMKLRVRKRGEWMKG